MDSIQQIPETDIEQQHSQALIIACSVFAALIVLGFNIIMPIILYYTWKDRSPIAANVGKKVINTQITMTLVSLAFVLLAIIMFVVMFAGNISIAAVSNGGHNAGPAIAGIGTLICIVLFYGAIGLWSLWTFFAMGWSVWQIIQVYNKRYDRLKAPLFTIPFFK